MDQFWKAEQKKYFDFVGAIIEAPVPKKDKGSSHFPGLVERIFLPITLPVVIVTTPVYFAVRTVVNTALGVKFGVCFIINHIKDQGPNHQNIIKETSEEVKVLTEEDRNLKLLEISKKLEEKDSVCIHAKEWKNSKESQTVQKQFIFFVDKSLTFQHVRQMIEAKTELMNKQSSPFQFFIDKSMISMRQKIETMLHKKEKDGILHLAYTRQQTYG